MISFKELRSDQLSQKHGELTGFFAAQSLHLDCESFADPRTNSFQSSSAGRAESDGADPTALLQHDEARSEEAFAEDMGSLAAHSLVLAPLGLGQSSGKTLSTARAMSSALVRASCCSSCSETASQ